MFFVGTFVLFQSGKDPRTPSSAASGGACNWTASGVTVSPMGKHVEIREDVNHHREIKAELQALGYEYAWQRKRWRVWGDSQYVADSSRDVLKKHPSG